MSKIQDYFNGVSYKLDAHSKISGTVEHNPDNGTNREIVLIDFLNKHLPRRIRANSGGKIISYDGKESKQLDVIVSNDIGIRFEENEKTFFSCESVVGVISVKTTLNSVTLIDSLENLLSVPDPNSKALTFHGLVNNPFEDFLEGHPSYIVFAYDGIEGGVLLKKVENYFKSNPQIPIRRFPKLIVVNNNYMIRFHRESSTTNTSYCIPAKSFFLTKLDDSFKGIPLVNLLNDLTSYLSWLKYMDFIIHPYFNNAYGLS